MKKTELVAGTVYSYASKRNGHILAYLVSGRRWYMDINQHGLRFTPVPAGAVSTAQERALAPDGAQAGWLVILFREGASVEETATAHGLTASDILDANGRVEGLPQFTRLAVVTHLWLSLLPGEEA